MVTVIPPYVDPGILEKHADRHSSGGADPLSPSAIGAAEKNHTHTPADIGAAASTHTHTPSSIGAAASDHTHTDYAAKTHSHDDKANLVNGKVPASELPDAIPAFVSWETVEDKPVTFPPETHTHDEYAAKTHSHDGLVDWWGFEIDMDKSDPEDRIQYTGLAAISSQAERKAWAYSKAHPSVVGKTTAEPVYFLNRKNLAQKEDGTASVLDGSAGDVCSSIEPLWWVATRNGNRLSVRLYEKEVPGSVSAHKYGGTYKKYVHIGMFGATGTGCDSVYNTSVLPVRSQPLKTYRAQSKTKTNFHNPVTGLTWTLFTWLFIMAHGTTNSQSKFAGITGLSWNNGTYPGSNPCISEFLTCEGEYASTDSTRPNMFLFVANFSGFAWMFLDGVLWNGGEVACLTDQADVWDIEQGYANKPASWHTFTSGIGTAANASYIKHFKGDPYFGCFPDSTGGDSATYAADACWSNTGERCCVVGGAWHYAASAGLFALAVTDAPSHSSADVGARLQILNAT